MNSSKVISKILILLTIVWIVTSSAPTFEAHASSASIIFTCDSDDVRVGDVIIVNLEISAEVIPGRFVGFITYNSDVLDFVTGPECMSGGEGVLRISDDEPDSEQTTRKYVLYFKAAKIGNSAIGMRGTPELYDEEYEQQMSVSSNILNLEVHAAKLASSDAALSQIKISNGVLNPAFSSDVKEYRTSVPYELENIIVSATARDAKSTVKIEGNTGLYVGQNRVLILVTAEDGTTEKYVIYVVREEKAPEQDVPEAGNDENTAAAGEASSDGSAGNANETDGGNGDLVADNAQNTDVGSAETAGADTGSTSENESGNGASGTSGAQDSKHDSEGFSFYASNEGDLVILNTSTRYTICKDDGSVEIPKGFFKTSVVISGFTVTAYSPEEDLSSDYLLLLLAKDGGKPGLYTFDRVEKTVQRFNGEISKNKTASGYSTIEDSELAAGYEKSLSNMTLIIVVLSGVCMMLLIVAIRSALRAHSLENDAESSSSRHSSGSSSGYSSSRSSGSAGSSSRSSGRTGSSSRSSGTRTGSTSRTAGSTGRSSSGASRGNSKKGSHIDLRG